MPMRIVVESVGATQILVRNRARIARLKDLSTELDAAQKVFYGAEESWFDSKGNGTWPELAESTIRSKTAMGVSEPDRPLVAFGSLRSSVTSSSGPYSFVHRLSPYEIVIGANWDIGGWQIPTVLSEGDATHPARHIWPSHESEDAVRMRASIGELLLKGI